MTALFVVIGGCIGAIGRFATDQLVSARHASRFPLGTWCVNMAGSLVLGILAGAAPAPWVAALLATGGCGALTTFSAFSFETVRLFEDRERATAALNVVASLVVGFALLVLGFVLGQALS